MTYKELAKEVASRSNISAVAAEQILDKMCQVLSEKFETGEYVNFARLGKMKVKKREQRQGRNPKNGDAANIPARYAVLFEPGKALKKRLLIK